MTVAEIRAKLPLAKTYELSQDKRYLIVVDPTAVSADSVERLLWDLQKAGIRATAISMFGPADVRIFDMEAPDHP